MPYNDPAKRRANDAKNLANLREKQAIWRAEHREEQRQWFAKWRAEHRKEIQTRDRAAYAANPGPKKEQARKIREADVEAYRAKSRKRQNDAYAKNPEKIKLRASMWRKEHPEVSRADVKRRRALKKGSALNDFTAQQWEEMKVHYGHRCVYCGRRMQRLTQDHIIPLSKGGAHTKSNIVPACLSCNSKKHTGPPLVPVQPLLL